VRRTVIVLLLLFICLGLVAAAPAGAATAGSKAVTSLTVKVTDLPHRVAGSVLITGPGGYRRHASASVTLTRLKPGKYAISAAAVTGPGYTYVPTVTGASLMLKSGHSATSAVAYYTRIPMTTRPLLAKDVTSVTAGTGGAETVVTTGAAPVKAGDIIAAGTGPVTPRGLLLKVTSVKAGGATQTLTAKPATLRQAIPQGAFNASGTFSGIGTGAGGPAAVRAASRPASEVLNCGAGATVTFGASISGSITTHFSASWSLRGVSATATATAHEQSQVTAAASANASCTLRPVAIGPQFKLTPFVVQIGPIPLVVVPTVQDYLKGAASVSGKVAASVSQQFNATAGLSYANGHLTPIHDVSDVTSYTGPTLNGAASLEATVGPTVSLSLYGEAGPDINIDPGLSSKDSSTANPSWHLDAILRAGATLKIPELGINASNEAIINLSKVLASGGSSKIIRTSGIDTDGSAWPVLGPDGRIWIVATGPSGSYGTRLQAVNTKTDAITTYNLPSDSGTIWFPGPLYRDNAGNLWVVAENDSATYLVRYTPATGAVKQFSVPTACQHGGFVAMSATPAGRIWLECGSGGLAFLTMTTAGATSKFAVPSQYDYLGTAVPGPGGTMWMTGDLQSTLGYQTGRIEVTPTGGFHFFPDPANETSDFLTGNGKIVIDALYCGSGGASLCYDSVSSGGTLSQLAVSPDPSGQDAPSPTTGAIDDSGNFWILIFGDDVVKTPTFKFFLEVTPSGETRTYAYWLPSPYSSTSPGLSGPPAFTSDSTLWGEIMNALNIVQGTSLNGELLRFKP